MISLKVSGGEVLRELVGWDMEMPTKDRVPLSTLKASIKAHPALRGDPRWVPTSINAIVQEDGAPVESQEDLDLLVKAMAGEPAWLEARVWMDRSWIGGNGNNQ